MSFQETGNVEKMLLTKWCRWEEDLEEEVVWRRRDVSKGRILMEVCEWLRRLRGPQERMQPKDSCINGMPFHTK